MTVVLIVGIWLGVIALTQPPRTVLLCAAAAFTGLSVAYSDLHMIRGRFAMVPWGLERWAWGDQFGDFVAQWPLLLGCVVIAAITWAMGRFYFKVR